MIPWLIGDAAFPSLRHALREPNGLLCAGGELSPARLLSAYRQGIFPWFSEGQPILWWSPDPRMVLFPSEFRLSRSLLRTLRRGNYEVRLDSAFGMTLEACATTPREGQPGTWITEEMRVAYRTLHELGFAHSVEVWMDGMLAGGLYGVALGRVFYGESMFSRVTDGSKIALAHLVSHLHAQGFEMIDCQMHTPHLASLGAREISRQEFVQRVADLVEAPVCPGRWPVDAAHRCWKDRHVTTE